MALVVPETLMPDAQCVSTCIPSGYQIPALISIFAKIAQMNIDPATLMPDALCVSACIPPGYQMAVLISLATQILNHQGDIENTGQIFAYTGASPTADGLVPTNQNNPAIAYKRNGTGPTFVWNTLSHVWV